MSLTASVLEGNRLALARLLTQVENNTPEGREALSELFPYTGKAHLIGVTGAPGTGKSSLVNQLARFFRQQEEDTQSTDLTRRVGIVAVDPSSPFTGGAILGDRVRMRDLAGDSGVFIRSMASRGSLGGLAHTTGGIVQALDAAGFEVILIETVGAGQAEVDIARLAHTTLVVEAPGLGDDIQAIKAGILEIADILVINKADRPGVESTERALRSMLQLAYPVSHIFLNHEKLHHGLNPEFTNQSGETIITDKMIWNPPIVKTIATEGNGVRDLASLISQHYEFLQKTGEWERRELARLQSELNSLLQETLVDRWKSSIAPEEYELVLQSLFRHDISPWQAVEVLLSGMKK